MVLATVEFGMLVPVSQFGVYGGIIMLGCGILSIVVVRMRFPYCQDFGLSGFRRNLLTGAPSATAEGAVHRPQSCLKTSATEKKKAKL